jgi:hypothetical protein
MDLNTKTFCDMIRTRSRENQAALQCFEQPQVVASPVLSILRQEVDSLLRVVYLLSVKDIRARQRLIDSTLRGGKWTIRSANGRLRDVTDRDMVNLAEKLRGWTKSVYQFGCGIVHLAEFHTHFAANPFGKLKHGEKLAILSYLRRYHGGPEHDKPGISELLKDGPQVFEKISGNLERCLTKLEQDGSLDELAALPGAATDT